MKILFVQRKPIKESKSIEFFVDNIIKHYPSEIEISYLTSQFSNQGLFHRLLNMFLVIWRPKADLYHVPGDANYLAILLPKKKTIITIHDIYYVYYAQMSNNPIIRFIKFHFNKWFFYKIPVWRASIVAVNSEFTKNELVNLTGCNPEKVLVLYAPTNSAFYPQPKQINKENPKILQIGIMLNKNLSRLAEALKGIPCQLEIVGKPSEEDLQKLNSLKINYQWEANISHEKLLQKYVEADILSFVSIFEGFGSPIIEAQCVERVVVTSITAAMPEVAGDGACLVDPYDINSIRNGILRVVSDDSYRELLIEIGRKNRTKYYAEKVANNYLNLYEQVLHYKFPITQRLPSSKTAV